MHAHISAATQASLLTVQKVRKAGFIDCLAGLQIMIMQLFFLNKAQALDNP